MRDLDRLEKIGYGFGMNSLTMFVIALAFYVQISFELPTLIILGFAILSLAVSLACFLSKRSHNSMT